VKLSETSSPNTCQDDDSDRYERVSLSFCPRARTAVSPNSPKETTQQEILGSNKPRGGVKE
jgi:hypothetical protein